mmetsp:Transcript_41638/g.93231  ORF Transcript_41638/g.93231 Transcript_41638/m.93231 type:complete len:197 (+) Transcript_41638:30-620(+)
MCAKADRTPWRWRSTLRSRVPRLSLLVALSSCLPCSRHLGSAFAAPAPADGGEKEAANVDRLMMKVLTPEGLQVKTVVSSVSLPGVEGRLGILRNHAPLLAPLSYGLLRYRRQGTWVPMVLRGGFASVQNNVITVLTTACERANEMPDVKDAREALEEATEAFTAAESRPQRLAASDALKLASARLQAAMLLAKGK